MNIVIYTSRHSKNSAIALGKALNSSVYNPYEYKHYRESDEEQTHSYNMGCNMIDTTFNDRQQVGTCINKIHTLDRLKSFGVLTVPYTTSNELATVWLDEDRILVNRATIIGKANEGISFSYKNLPDVEDEPRNFNAIIWTRYVNHTNELRVYAINGKYLAFRKEQHNDLWHFKPVDIPSKLKEQLLKADQAFDKMFLVAYDILECVTGDYYFLEANSAPSLLTHRSILPALTSAIQEQVTTDVMVGIRKHAIARTMGVEWTRHATRISHMREMDFLGQFGSEISLLIQGFPDWPQGETFRRLIDLHRRQSGIVIGVLPLHLLSDIYHSHPRSLSVPHVPSPNE